MGTVHASQRTACIYIRTEPLVYLQRIVKTHEVNTASTKHVLVKYTVLAVKFSSTRFFGVEFFAV